MENHYSVQQIHYSLKQQLLNYIKTEYFGKNDALRDACKENIERKGVLYQEPFIEANPAYMMSSQGIEGAEIPDKIKEILMRMSDLDLGVYKTPYVHQVEALEQFFRGQDVLVATGTGSGKTECFMWPMVSQLVSEAMERPQSWQTRGVRTVIMYPMNALVADQMGRLRKMIGYRQNGFSILFEELTNYGRIPQFGMYTGRTPYPGEQVKKRDKDFADSLEAGYADRTEKMQEELIKFGKMPAKFDLMGFCNSVRNGEHYTDINDAELISRFEMQTLCPDILITNYSMLEYMLIRNIEAPIWKNTKNWLAISEENKLTFIIDEAHMYRGAAGGEVAYLIRRMIHKLGIDRSKVQFILTSASIPKDKMDDVKRFAEDLTGLEHGKRIFSIITGEQVKVQLNEGFDFSADVLTGFPIDDFYDEDKRNEAIALFAKCVGFSLDTNVYKDKKTLENILFQKLYELRPIRRMLKQCRQNAIAFNKLAKAVFPEANNKDAQNALNVLLAIAPLAKNANNEVLFPARLHMFFRGLHGVYACLNPDCTNGNSKKLGLGHIYLSYPGEQCDCGGRIYELINHRSCGALFIKGYVVQIDGQGKIVWSHLGTEFDEDFKEVHFYLPSPDEEYRIKKDEIVCWLDAITGRLYEGSEHEGEKGFIQVVYCTKEKNNRPNQLTFSTCPKCGKQNTQLSNLETKNNEPFYNIVSKQLMTQPATLFEKEEIEKTPNEGRKVLLFSDSRQQAAKLARQLTNAADENAMRNALILAAKELQENDDEPDLDKLYISFLKIAIENKLKFFYGDSEQQLLSDMNKVKRHLNGKKFSYYKMQKKVNKNRPGLYYYHLLKQICDNYRSVTDISCCWLEPSEDIEDLIEDFEKECGVKCSVDDFISFFAAWCADISTGKYALGEEISDEIRDNINIYGPFGLKYNSEMVIRKYLQKVLRQKGVTEEQIQKISDYLKGVFLSKNVESGYLFLQLGQIKLVYSPEHTWYKCPKCGKIFPFTLWGNCALCGKGKPVIMKPSDYEGINFWRVPALKTVAGDQKGLSRINTEEHSAQLSRKDSISNNWATTEEYEMRFQNIYVDNDKPIDILSCTTTMEVGIDIGNLTAIGLRNIPPVRENYQQRAGRAGRRSAAVSSIVTYAGNGPHDSYYFYHPERIITGEPRSPWIDISSKKILGRHLNVVIFSEFLLSRGSDTHSLGISVFYNEMYEDFKEYLQQWNPSEKTKNQLYPRKMNINIENFKQTLIEALEEVQEDVKTNGELYGVDSNNEMTILNCFTGKGIFPTYSFPRDLVSYYIEDYDGEKIIQEPTRALDVAISEYAPGGTIVVNKKTYQSGGIYSFYTKMKKGEWEHPARSYFKQKAYYRDIYYCKNPGCNWFGFERSQNGRCPFCGGDIETKKFLKPWGFAPINGQEKKRNYVDSEGSFAETPSYSLTPNKDDMKDVEGYQRMRVTQRSDQPLIVVNKGPEDKGFLICKDCGAAVPANQEHGLNIGKPFKHPIKEYTCQHDKQTIAYLGHEFRTDMVLFEIKINKSDINMQPDGNKWLQDAAQTLSEAMVLAAGRLLDIEFNELKNGYRMRILKSEICVDIYLYDSLTSGAGYSTTLSVHTIELLNEAKKILTECPSHCKKACHDCLEHYWNQRVHWRLDRFAASDLLEYSRNQSLPDAYSFEEQQNYLMPLFRIMKTDNHFDIQIKNNKILVQFEKKQKELYVHPIMWNQNDERIPKKALALTDYQLERALPYAYKLLLDAFR